MILEKYSGIFTPIVTLLLKAHSNKIIKKIFSRKIYRLPLLIFPFALTACKPPPAIIDGSVFIVTNGGINYKLGLVEVQAIKKVDALPLLESEQARINSTSKKLIEDIKTSKKEADEIYAEIDENIKSVRRMNESASSGGSIKREYGDTPEILAVKEQLLQTRIRLLESAKVKAVQIHSLKPEYNRQITKIQTMCAELEEIFSGTAIIQSLPRAVSIGKTDADGRFRLTLPKGQYILSAHATRQAGNNEIEQYSWFVELSIPLTSIDKIMLSNDNMSTSNSQENILKLGTSPGECKQISPLL